MTRSVRDILDVLGGESLSRLCEHRGLPKSGLADDKRKRLAHSCRGNPSELIEKLQRKDLIAALESVHFEWQENKGELLLVSSASLSELQAAARTLFVESWQPKGIESNFLGASNRIKISWPPQGTSINSSPQAPIMDAPYYGNSSDDIEADYEPIERSKRGKILREQDFISWLDERLANHSHSTMLIKNLVNKLGRYRAERGLSSKAKRDLAGVLARHGFIAEPDLNKPHTITGERAINGRVRISRGQTSIPKDQARREEWSPIPPPPPRNEQTPQYTKQHRSLLSEYEQAAIKLRFVAQVSKVISPLGETEQQKAVEYSMASASLGTADRVRLRALAHQYSTVDIDLAETVRQLRLSFGSEERQQLLEFCRELVPAGPKRDEVINTYAKELEVDPPSTPQAKESVMVSKEAGDKTSETSKEESFQAGGIRNNPILDSIIIKGSGT